jgi:hypothetical protein
MRELACEGGRLGQPIHLRRPLAPPLYGPCPQAMPVPLPPNPLPPRLALSALLGIPLPLRCRLWSRHVVPRRAEVPLPGRRIWATLSRLRQLRTPLAPATPQHSRRRLLTGEPRLSRGGGGGGGGEAGRSVVAIGTIAEEARWCGVSEQFGKWVFVGLD